MRSMEMSGLMVMPKSMGRAPFGDSLPRMIPCGVFRVLLARCLHGRRRLGHEPEIDDKTDEEADKPGVVVEHAERRDDQADEGNAYAGHQRGDGGPMKAAGIFIPATPPVKVLNGENFLAHHEIIADQNAGDGAEKAGVANEPGKNVTPVARQQLPGLHEEAHNGGDHAAGTKTDAARGKIGEVVGGRDDVGGDVDIQSGHEQRDHGEHYGPRIAEARQDFDGIPDGFTENDHGGGSDGDADERVKGHRGGQAQGLADYLVPLAAGVAREIGNVERNGGPKADDAGKRGNKELEKTAERLKFRGRRKHGAETAGFAARPEKKNQADEEQEGRGDALQEADGLDAPQDDEDVEKPEEHKANGCARVDLGPARSEGHDHGVDGFAADPGLNAKPAASNQGAENRGNIRPKDTKRSAGKNGKRDAVLRAGVRVEQHGDQHEDVAEKDGDERLAPVHAAGNHAAREHVGGDVDAHGDPQSCVVVGTPAATVGTNGGEVLVVEGAGFDDIRVKRLAVRFAHSKP